MSSRWVKLHAQTLENKIWRYDPTAWRVFEYLLLSCNYKTGQVKKAHSTMIEFLGIPKSTLSRAISRLEKAKMVNRQRNSDYTLYSICNWSKYQQGVEQETEQQRNNNGTYSRNIELIINPVTDLDKKLQDFINHRSEIKHPMTERGLVLLRTELNKLYPDDPVKQIDSLNKSIINGWQGVFKSQDDRQIKNKEYA